jgi:O-antigen/teichoic acid export membrane protein
MKSINFFKGFSWLILLNVIVKPVWIFAIDRKVQLISGNEVYGAYFSVYNLSMVLIVFADAGITNLLNQKLSYYKAYNIKTILLYKALLLVLYIFVFLIIGTASHINQALLFYIVSIQALTSLFTFLRGIITAHQYFITDAFLSIIDKTLMILLCSLFLYTSLVSAFSLFTFLKIQLLCTAFAVAVVITIIITKTLYRNSVSAPHKLILYQLIPFALIIFLMSLHYRMDGFLLLKLFHGNGAIESGIYAKGYRLLDASNMIGYLAASFLVPFIARNKSDTTLINTTTSNVLHIILSLALAVISFVFVFAPWIEMNLYHSNSIYESTILKLCMASLPGYYFVHIYGSILTATEQFRKFINVLTLSVFINLLMNCILIPQFGAKGCCLASIVSQHVCGLLLFLQVKKSFITGGRIKNAFVYVSFCLSLGLVYYVGKLCALNVWFVLLTGIIVTLLFIAFRIAYIKNFLTSTIKSF